MKRGQMAADHAISNGGCPSGDGILSWTYSTRTLHRDKMAVYSGAIAFTAVAAFLLFHNIAASLLTASVLFFSTAEAIVPLTYILDAEKVIVKIGLFEWLELPWKDVRSVYSFNDGIKLSVFDFPQSAPFEPVRGVKLRFPETLRGQVTAFIDRAASNH